MSAENTLFHFDDGRPSFEDLGQPNGTTHWTEEVLMRALAYDSKQGFAKAINRAKQACLSVDLPCEDHFVRQADGSHLFTRFGCYLVAMNGDIRKREVAAAQAWFATLAQTFQNHIESSDGIDRVLIREEVTDGQRSLASTASQHGVVRFDFFMHKGYLGMYNMGLSQILQRKRVSGNEKLIDRMGKAELAAHLFRITQTDEKIKNENITGQNQLERAAFDVGKTVRATVIELSGTRPEDMPPAEHIQSVRKKIKSASKQLRALDAPKTPPTKRLPPPPAD
jgi:DNA-damage-inducible protein D